MQKAKQSSALSKKFAYFIALTWVIVSLIGLVRLLIINSQPSYLSSLRYADIIFATAMLFVLYLLIHSQPRVFRKVWIVLWGGGFMSHILMVLFSRGFFAVLLAKTITFVCGLYGFFWFMKYYSKVPHKSL